MRDRKLAMVPLHATELCAVLALASAALPARAQEKDPAPAISMYVSYTADVWGAPQGGSQPGTAYLDNLEFVADVDFGRVNGLQSTAARVSVLRNNAASFTDKYVGDFQVVSNIDTAGSLRLYEAWIERRMGKISFKAGLQNLNEDFDINETGGLFINSSHGIGPEISQLGANGPGIFPVSALGARAIFEIDKSVIFKVGVFEALPGNIVRPTRTRLKIDSGEGQLVLAQMDSQPSQALRISGGLWHRRGAEQLEPILQSTAKGAFGIVEAKLANINTGSLSAFLRAGAARGSELTVGTYFGAGLVYQGPIFGRLALEESAGIAIASAHSRAAYRRVREIGGMPTHNHETVIEFTYRARAAPWVTIQPDIQYIIHPGFERGRRSVLAAGLRLVFDWSNAD